MHNPRPLPWFSSFVRDWILPKSAVALAVVAVSNILFSLDPSTKLPEPAQRRFDSIFSLTSSDFYMYALGVIGVVFLLALFTRHTCAGRNRPLYLLDRNVARAGLVLNSIFGFIQLPMVVSISALTMIPGNHQLQLALFAMSAVAFVLFGAWLHYIRLQGEQPRHSISYIISAKYTETTAENFHYQTFMRLSEVLSYVPWHGGPKVTTETFDLQISLEIPIYLHISSWQPPERDALRRFLSAIELEWKQANFEVVRRDSPEVFSELTQKLGEGAGLPF